MNSNKINIKCIVILSAVILLLCIICAMLTLDNKNKANIQTTQQSNNTTDNITKPETSTETTNKHTVDSETTATTGILTPLSPTKAPTQNKPIQQEATPAPITEAPNATTAPATSSDTDNTENHTTEQATAITEPTTTNDEELLEKIITHSGYTLKDIADIKAEQLIIVTDYNSSSGAIARLFSLNNNKWQKEKLDCRVHVGSNGIANKANDNDSITPTGLYTIGDAFYIDEKPSTWLNTFKITNNTYWITNTDSDMYNKKIELEGNEDFGNAIHMINSSSYRYGCVINYNTNPVIKGKGSAIFMECGDSATNGSIAFAENDLLKYLEILNSEKKPAIVIF